MPFQAGSENFELSFQGKSLHLAVVPVAGMGMSGHAGGSREDVGSGFFLARPAVWGVEASGHQKTHTLILALTYSSCVTPGAALGLSRPQFSHLSNGGPWAKWFLGVTSSVTILSFRFWACCFPAEA